MSFRHEKRINETELSKQLWQLKEECKEFTITWKILAKAKPHTNLTKQGIQATLVIYQLNSILSQQRMPLRQKDQLRFTVQASPQE